MLYYKTVEPKTLELLKSIQCIPEFNSLRLVGGTALALQIGHRKSIDLDFFGTFRFDEKTLTKKLKTIGNVEPVNLTKHIKVFLINEIKVDFVNYEYKWLDPPVSENSLVIANTNDIAAMKLDAVSGRGTKKVFIDIFYLLKSFTLSEMLCLYKKKFEVESEFMILRSLAYFNDAEKDEMPEMINNISWNTIKEEIRNALRNFELK
jgi:hypothetical protein